MNGNGIMILEMILEKKNNLCQSFANMVLDLIPRNLNSKVKDVEEEKSFFSGNLCLCVILQ